MQKVSNALFALVSLAACAPTYTPPEEARTIATRHSAEIISYEDAIIRAAFRSGSAIAEVEKANCTLTYWGATTRFFAPHRVRIPIHDGSQTDLRLECQTEIGPSSVKSARVITPSVPEHSKDAPDQRIYPDTFAVIFR
jgi:predicted small lipoprotein YifL